MARAVAIAACVALLLPAHAFSDDTAVMALVRGGLRSLHRMQRDDGEWPCQMVNRWLPPNLILPQDEEWPLDSNSFTTAWTHNLIADVYLAHPELDAIPPMMERAGQALARFRHDGAFGFWPFLPILVPDEGHLHRVWARGPEHYQVWGWIRGAVNIPNDADDTAIVVAGEALSRRVQERLGRSFSTAIFDGDPAAIFSRYRDQHRLPHPYNLVRGAHVRTGAYLTWLAEEPPVVTPWNLFGALDETGIPFAHNDVDCVVNANVLRALALTGNAQAPGTADACTFIDDVTRHSEYPDCGIYYPNRFALHFTAALAWKAGVRCLDASAGRMLDDLLRSQNLDGSWRNTAGPNDTVHASAFALAALVELADPRDPRHRETVARGMRFLVDQARHDANGVHWDAGTAFTAGTIVRQLILWQSTAYTTALCIRAILAAQDFLDVTG